MPRTHLAPADRVTLAILIVVWITLTLRLPAVATLRSAWILHTALLAGFAALAAAMAARPLASWISSTRAVAIIAIMFALYLSLGKIAFAAIPWLGDPALAAADTWLFAGQPPALRIQPFVTPARLEFFSVIYAAFIPYLYMSVLLGCVGRPARERDAFVLGFALTYAISFLGYLFVPARGPVVQHAQEFTAVLTGGAAHRLVLSSI